MVPLLVLRRFQLAGHKPIALVGGATGLIGDPSFKSAERQLNSTDVVEEWVERLKPQLSQFLDFDCGANSAVLINNLDWTQNLDLLTFLRTVGKHFSVNSMIQKESVKQRIEREGEGISFSQNLATCSCNRWILPNCIRDLTALFRLVEAISGGILQGV